MAINLTTVFTFKIRCTFDEWLEYFDSIEASEKLSEFGIKPIYRGKSKEDHQKVIVIHEAPEGNMQKFFETHGSWIATHGVNVSTIEVSDWI